MEPKIANCYIWGSASWHNGCCRKSCS